MPSPIQSLHIHLRPVYSIIYILIHSLSKYFKIFRIIIMYQNNPAANHFAVKKANLDMSVHISPEFYLQNKTYFSYLQQAAENNSRTNFLILLAFSKSIQ